MTADYAEDALRRRIGDREARRIREARERAARALLVPDQRHAEEVRRNWAPLTREAQLKEPPIPPNAQIGHGAPVEGVVRPGVDWYLDIDTWALYRVALEA